MTTPIRRLQLSNDPQDADLLADIDAYRAHLSRRHHQVITLDQAYRQLIALFILSDLPLPLGEDRGEGTPERITP